MLPKGLIGWHFKISVLADLTVYSIRKGEEGDIDS
jgi:hypothetical protein